MEALERMEERIQDLEQLIKKAILQKQGSGEWETANWYLLQQLIVQL